MQILELSSKTEKKAFRNGQDIVKQGANFSSHFWVIYEGSADAYWTDPETNERHHVSPEPKEMRITKLATQRQALSPRPRISGIHPCLPWISDPTRFCRCARDIGYVTLTSPLRQPFSIQRPDEYQSPRTPNPKPCNLNPKQVARLSEGAVFGLSEFPACPHLVEGFNANVVASGAMLALCVERTVFVSDIDDMEPGHGRPISPVPGFKGGCPSSFSPRSFKFVGGARAGEGACAAPSLL